MKGIKLFLQIWSNLNTKFHFVLAYIFFGIGIGLHFLVHQDFIAIVLMASVYLLLIITSNLPQSVELLFEKHRKRINAYLAITLGGLLTLVIQLLFYLKTGAWDWVSVSDLGINFRPVNSSWIGVNEAINWIFHECYILYIFLGMLFLKFLSEENIESVETRYFLPLVLISISLVFSIISPFWIASTWFIWGKTFTFSEEIQFRLHQQRNSFILISAVFLTLTPAVIISWAFRIRHFSRPLKQDELAYIMFGSIFVGLLIVVSASALQYALASRQISKEEFESNKYKTFREKVQEGIIEKKSTSKIKCKSK